MYMYKCICTNKRKIQKIKSTYLERINLLFLFHKLMYFKHFKILSPATNREQIG